MQANNHPIYNPSLDYSVYLSQPFFFVLFQVLVLLITVYAVGSEIKFGTAGQWLQAAGGDITVAVTGKLLPYTLIFSLIGILGNFVMFGILHIPFQGSWLLLNVMTVLFIIATQALALFIFSLFPAVAIIISIVSMVGSLGATLSGVTFPVLNMYPLVRDASYLFPVRHYIRNYTNHALLWRRIYPPMAFGSDTLYLPVIGVGDASAPQTSHNQS